MDFFELCVQHHEALQYVREFLQLLQKSGTGVMDLSVMFPSEIIQPELFAGNWDWPELSGVRKRGRHDGIRLRLKLQCCWWILLSTVTLVNAQMLFICKGNFHSWSSHWFLSIQELILT